MAADEPVAGAKKAAKKVPLQMEGTSGTQIGLTAIDTELAVHIVSYLGYRLAGSVVSGCTFLKQVVSRYRQRLLRLDDVTRPRGVDTECWIDGKVSDVAISSIASQCPNLKYFVLSDAQHGLVTDEAVSVLSRLCPQLTILGLRGQSKLTDRTLLALSINCVHLTELMLLGSKQNSLCQLPIGSKKWAQFLFKLCHSFKKHHSHSLKRSVANSFEQHETLRIEFTGFMIHIDLKCSHTKVVVQHVTRHSHPLCKNISIQPALGVRFELVHNFGTSTIPELTADACSGESLHESDADGMDEYDEDGADEYGADDDHVDFSDTGDVPTESCDDEYAYDCDDY